MQIEVPGIGFFIGLAITFLVIGIGIGYLVSLLF